MSLITIAEDPRTTVQYLSQLAANASSEVRIAVSDNPNTSIPILEMLALDSNPDVRFAMAENARVPTHILKMLARDDHPYVADRAVRTLTRLKQSNPMAITSGHLRVVLNCA